MDIKCKNKNCKKTFDYSEGIDPERTHVWKINSDETAVIEGGCYCPHCEGYTSFDFDVKFVFDYEGKMLISEAELDLIKKTEYERGVDNSSGDYQRGYDKGYDEGYDQAEQDFDNSDNYYNDGHDDGYRAGYEDGYKEGCKDGSDDKPKDEDL